MSRNFGKVWNCVSTVLVALVVLLAALLAGARLFAAGLSPPQAPL